MTEGTPVHLEIAEPCPAAWDSMAGMGAARHCRECRKTVHDLSAMGPAGAAELVASTATAGVCVRVRCDSQGFVLYDSPSERAAQRRLRLLSPAVLVTLAACSVATEGELPLVVETPPAATSTERARAVPEPARPESPDAVGRSAGGPWSAGNAAPVRAVKDNAHEPNQVPEPRTRLLMGVVLAVPGPPLAPLRASPKSGHASGNSEKDFDFGI